MTDMLLTSAVGKEQPIGLSLPSFIFGVHLLSVRRPGWSLRKTVVCSAMHQRLESQLTTGRMPARRMMVATGGKQVLASRLERHLGPNLETRAARHLSPDRSVTCNLNIPYCVHLFQAVKSIAVSKYDSFRQMISLHQPSPAAQKAYLCPTVCAGKKICVEAVPKINPRFERLNW